VAKLYNISHINRFKVDIENALGPYSIDYCQLVTSASANLYRTSDSQGPADPHHTPGSHFLKVHMSLKLNEK